MIAYNLTDNLYLYAFCNITVTLEHCAFYDINSKYATFHIALPVSPWLLTISCYTISHMSHILGVCEWVSPWLSWLLAFLCSVWVTCRERRNVRVSSTVAMVTGCVFCKVSNKFENTGDHHGRRKKIIVVWTRWLTRINMAKLTFPLNSLSCTVHLECHPIWWS